MGALADIHTNIFQGLTKHFALDRVQLKHALPVRPPRMLGLMKMDGDIYSTDKLQRVACLRISMVFFMKVFSTFIRPKVDYDLPAFICEVVYVGKKVIVIIDIHRTGDVAELEQDKDFFDGLMGIKERYSDLLAFRQEAKGGMAEMVSSRAEIRLKITAAQEPRVLELAGEYLEAYVRYVDQSRPLAGEALARAQENFERYLETVKENDPGVRGNKIFFGKKEGVDRALEMFFGM